jgi:hypothetical protein
MIEVISPRKVRISREGVAAFNARWPGSSLRDRAYWFEFDARGDLIDVDVPEQDDGPAALAMSQDAQAFLEDGTLPEWAAAYERALETVARMHNRHGWNGV